MTTLDQLEQEYREKLAALKTEKEKKVKAEKARLSRKTAQEKARLRKKDAHLKILIGGYILSTKNREILKKLADTALSDKDKALIADLLKSL